MANPRDESSNNLLPPLPFWPSLSLTGDSDFTLGSSESQHMNYMVGMVRSPNIAQVTPKVLNNEGFEGWWNPVKKISGQIDFGGGRCVLIAHTHGALGGRSDTIFRYTDRKDKKLVRDFLQNVKTLPPLVGECEKEHLGRCNPCASRTKDPIVFLSRYRDNIL